MVHLSENVKLILLGIIIVMVMFRV